MRPSVTAISPTAVVAGLTSTFAVTGRNLPLTAIMSLADGSCSTPTNRTNTGFSVSCTPGTSTGNKVVTISTAAIGGVVIDSSRVIAVTSAPLSTTTFLDNFDGAGLDLSRWTKGGTGVFGVTGGEAQFGCSTWIDTKGKVAFSGNQIIIEAKMVGPGVLRDTVVALYEPSTGKIIQGGDTNYQGRGLYIFATGGQPTEVASNGKSNSSYKEFRMTLTGSSVLLERGDSLAAISETLRLTLPTSIANRSFYLLIGTGGPDYCPGKIDWVNVTTK